MKPIITGQFSEAIPPIMDGVAFVAQNYFHYLNEKYGHSYLIGPEVSDYDYNDPSVIRYKSMLIPTFHPYRVGIPAIGSFRKQLDLINFDLVHTHTPFIAGEEALRIAKRRNIPIVASFHSKYREDFTKALKSKTLAEQVVKYIVHYYEKVDVVWVPNEQTKETLSSYGFKGTIDIARNGSEMIPLDQATHAKMYRELREQRGIDEHEVVLLYVGQLREEKNLYMIVETIEQLIEQKLPIRAFFIGTGRDEQKLKQMVEDKGLGSFITFTGVIRDRELLKSYYSCSDIFTFPSLYDNASLAMREAAACRLPTIAIERASTAQGIIDGQNGFLIENRVPSFVNKIRYLVENPEIRKRSGHEAQKTIFVSYETIVDEIYERYLKIIHDKKVK